MNILILFGGKSTEHEISIKSAKNIFKFLNKERFKPLLVGISKKGSWFLCDEVSEKAIKNSSIKLKVTPSGGKNFLYSKEKKIDSVDFVFPALHGFNGEDGTIQGLLDSVDIPFAFSGVLGSAAAMDKDISKILMQSKGIPVVDYLAFKKSADLDIIEERFNYPIFVKPATLGSSIGISKARDRKSIQTAIKEAFKYDEKILIEESINGRELECSVLGNQNPKASCVGEIKTEDFYSYEEKYSEESKTELIIPADIDISLEKKIRRIAIQAFKALMCEGVARVDFFAVRDRVYVNEINTIPGFTINSMCPKLWEESGLEYKDLITELINLGIKRYEEKKILKKDCSE